MLRNSFFIAALTVCLFSSSTSNAQTNSDETISELALNIQEDNSLLKEVEHVNVSNQQSKTESQKEIEQIKERLKILEKEAEATKKKQSETESKLSRMKWGGYLQTQFTSSDRKGNAPNNVPGDGFRFRRIRLGIESQVQPKLSLKVSFDFAAGPTQHQVASRDVFMTHDLGKKEMPSALKAVIGQFSAPVGFDIERSSADREVPERSRFSQTFFNTERLQGIYLKKEDSDGMMYRLGVTNSLSIEDPEQLPVAPANGSKQAVFGGLRKSWKNSSIGLSGFVGERPSYTANSVTSPQLQRRFLILDASALNLFNNKFNLRAEVITGFDRVPNATANVTSAGGHVGSVALLGTYLIGKETQFTTRWQTFDPNVRTANNGVSIFEVGIHRMFNKDSKILFSQEFIQDESRASFSQKRFNQFTIRFQTRI